MRRSGRRNASSRVVSGILGASLLSGVVACSDDRPAQPVIDTLGIRVGQGLFDGESFVEMESALGRHISLTVQFAGRRSQKDMNGSVFGLVAADSATMPEFADRLDLSITIPLGFGKANGKSSEGRAEIGSNLRAVADGEFDVAYQRVAERLVDGGFGDAVIRLGHEFNGEWAPWSAINNEEAYIAAWRHVHEIFRSVSTEFLFDWTAMRPDWVERGRLAYPGDDVVDIIGLDVYWRVPVGGDAWETDRWNRQYLSVLSDHLSFAIERGKPVSYPEWGLSGGDAAGFVEAMHAWFSELPAEGPGSLRYQAYFNSKEFALDRFPASQTAFLELFGS